MLREWSLASTLTLVAAVAIAMAAVVVLRRVARQRLQQDAGPVGAVVAISVTVYSLILGLTVVASYNRFTDAQTALTDELNALFATIRLANAYPASDAARISDLVLDYAHAVRDHELHGDDVNSVNTAPARAAIRGIYAVYASRSADRAGSYPALSSSIAAVMALDDARGIRLSLEAEVLPSYLWIILVMGGILAVLATGLVAPRSQALHLVVAVSTTLIIVLLLNLVAEMDRPFTYPVRVDTTLFERGIGYLEEEAALPGPSSTP